MTKKTADDGTVNLADEARERVAQLEDRVVHAVEERLDSLGKLIQKHPLLAVGIGFGAGYILARLLHRD